MPQIKAAIIELQAKGYDIPAYPDEGSSADDIDIKQRYGDVMVGRQPRAAPANPTVGHPKGGEGVREVAPAFDGGVVERLEDPRRDDG